MEWNEACIGKIVDSPALLAQFEATVAQAHAVRENIKFVAHVRRYMLRPTLGSARSIYALFFQRPMGTGFPTGDGVGSHVVSPINVDDGVRRRVAHQLEYVQGAGDDRPAPLYLFNDAYKAVMMAMLVSQNMNYVRDVRAFAARLR